MAAPHWWHYTHGVHFLRIMASGVIIRARTMVPKGERPAVWFSCRPTWDPIATKVRIGRDGVPETPALAEFVEATGALIRLEVPEAVARKTWADHRREGGGDPRAMDALERAAERMGSDVRLWRLTYRDVPIDQVVAAEWSLDGETWRAIGPPTDEGGMAMNAELIDRVRTAAARGRA